MRDALRERLEEVNWMSPLTRVEAMKKMEAFKVKIGFPDKWIDFSTFKVEKGQALKNYYASNAFSFQLELSRYGMSCFQTEGKEYICVCLCIVCMNIYIYIYVCVCVCVCECM